MFELLKAGSKQLLKQPFYSLYERRLEQEAKKWKKPQHLGVILDGNRRFARENNMQNVVFGHKYGADKFEEFLDWCFEYDIRVITGWAFSLDNFGRDESELDGLFGLIGERVQKLMNSPDIHKSKVRLQFFGKISMLPTSLQEIIEEARQRTREYDERVLNIALAYGGRDEIHNAYIRTMQEQLKSGRPAKDILDHLKPEDIESYLYTSGLPDPDLIIRTSGELRLSGFLLWQSAYAEYYFSDTYWPAFRKIDFLRALRSYHYRHRRFGR